MIEILISSQSHQVIQIFLNVLILLEDSLALQLVHNFGDLGLHDFHSCKCSLMSRASTSTTLLSPGS